jgi:hypothetical protein
LPLPKHSGNAQAKTYSVKYLGIVEGSMGILSRKMALKGEAREKPGSAVDKIIFNPSNRKSPKRLARASLPSKSLGAFRPVLGNKYNLHSQASLEQPGTEASSKK